MSLVKIPTDQLLPCHCGFKPDHYSISYGSAPYCVFCPECKRQIDGVGGESGAIIPWWNLVGRFAENSVHLNGFQGAPYCDPWKFCERGHPVNKKKEKAVGGKMGWYCYTCDGIYFEVNNSYTAYQEKESLTA